MAERYINIKTDTIDEYTPTKDTFDNYKNYIIAIQTSYDATTKVLTVEVGSNAAIKNGLMIGFPSQDDSGNKTEHITINNTNFYYFEGSDHTISNAVPKSIYNAVAGGYAIISIDPSTQSYTVVNEIMKDSAEGNYLPLTGGTLSDLLTINKTNAVDGFSSALFSLRSNKFPNSTRYTVDDKGLIKLISPATGDSYLYYNPNTNHLYMRKDADSSSGISMDYNTSTPYIEFLGTAGGRITNLATPTNNTDAANKAYVDSKSGGLKSYYIDNSALRSAVKAWNPDLSSSNIDNIRLEIDLSTTDYIDINTDIINNGYDLITLALESYSYFSSNTNDAVGLSAISNIILTKRDNLSWVSTPTIITITSKAKPIVANIKISYIENKKDKLKLTLDVSKYNIKRQVTANILANATWWDTSTNSYDLTISGITAKSTPHITPQYTTSNYEAVSAAWSLINFAETSTNRITFYALGDKPTTKIPLLIEWED